MSAINEWIAVRLAAAFSTMWCFWLFNALALLPLVWPASLDVVQFISSGWLQLISLPLLAVASAVSHRRTHQKIERHHAVIIDHIKTLHRPNRHD